jgi:hypothetical protein
MEWSAWEAAGQRVAQRLTTRNLELFSTAPPICVLRSQNGTRLQGFASPRQRRALATSVPFCR